MRVKECERAGLETQHPKTKIIAYGLINSWQIDGKKMEAVSDFIVLCSKMTADVDCRHEIKRRLLLGRKPMTNLGSILKSRDITLLTKVCVVKAIVFSSSHGGMWKLDHKGGWAPKNWCFQTVVLEKTLERVPWRAKRSVNTKENQPWIFTGRTEAEAEAPILWPPDVKCRLIGKDLGAEKDWRQEKKGVTEDEMVGWHHQLNVQEFEQTLGDSKGQGSLVCCGPWGSKSWTWLSD